MRQYVAYTKLITSANRRRSIVIDIYKRYSSDVIHKYITHTEHSIKNTENWD